MVCLCVCVCVCVWWWWWWWGADERGRGHPIASNTLRFAFCVYRTPAACCCCSFACGPPAAFSRQSGRAASGH
jgi:hypothetical protein